MISADQRYPKKYATVSGKTMAYTEAGDGDPIVFLHGNPTSSYLWRNVMPHVEADGRCIAPDLIGMGDSDKIEGGGDEAYRFVHHRDYLDGLFDELGIGENVILVGHDWGSALAFHWAHRFPERVKGIVYMEAIVQPFEWEEFPEALGEPESSRAVFRNLRSAKGEEMILENNYFVEKRLPSRIIRDLTEEEMAVYRRPFAEPGEDRRPTLTWARQLPISGEPEDVSAIVADSAAWLRECTIPKLFIRAEPGGLIQGARAEFCRTFANQTEVTVPGIHFVQEDSPDDIGTAIAAFVGRLDAA